MKASGATATFISFQNSRKLPLITVQLALYGPVMKSEILQRD
jgi:hypothetical protein